MKAIIYEKYGSPEVLQVKEIEKPVPGDNDVLIHVRATSVNYGDLAARNFKAISPREFNMPLFIWAMAKIFFGLNKPRTTILGSEFAGVVEAVGRNVTRFTPGNTVLGYLGQSMGAYAEYICMPQDGVLALKPDNISFEEAAVIPYGSIMAWFLLKKMNVQKGQKVLIIGASGGIGAAAVQIAKYLGAEVTGVCGTPRLEFVKSLGADRVIDYTSEDYTLVGETYDLIFDVLGRGSISRCRKILKPGGVHLFASFKIAQLISMLLSSRSSKRTVCAMAPGSLQDLNDVRLLIADGKIRAILDRQFSMDQAAEAHRYVEEGRKHGHVAIRIGENSKSERKRES
ncbi:MAG: NAD(P)-dependent alcohol dehydrogenase [Leptolinea sp.]|jgi:NADPH:quinone reductase-like Zn-dependent oxidoreductase|nr:NAD(P)-dependent alcohol dehydrogenase [Leptolinea sp.]